MGPRIVLVPLIVLALAAPAVAQTPPTIPPTAPPQIAPKPAAPAAVPTPTSQLQSEFAVAAGDTVLFPYQSKDLTLRSLRILDNQAKWLKARPELKITIEAYCDDDIEPARASEFCLSRAREVRDYLVKQGVASERMSLIAFDDTQAPRRNVKADDSKSDASKPGAPKPGATKPDASKPDAGKPDAKTADSTKKDKKEKKDDKARRTNRRVSTRVSA
ncbi:MAG: OmpA family protein [Alphaproteobacteria bacterium]|nr:OmpA family protein [Alphaproteobacteria bacterium]